MKRTLLALWTIAMALIAAPAVGQELTPGYICNDLGQVITVELELWPDASPTPDLECVPLHELPDFPAGSPEALIPWEDVPVPAELEDTGEQVSFTSASSGAVALPSVFSIDPVLAVRFGPR